MIIRIKYCVTFCLNNNSHLNENLHIGRCTMYVLWSEQRENWLHALFSSLLRICVIFSVNSHYPLPIELSIERVHSLISIRNRQIWIQWTLFIVQAMNKHDLLQNELFFYSIIHSGARFNYFAKSMHLIVRLYALCDTTIIIE